MCICKKKMKGLKNIWQAMIWRLIILQIQRLHIALNEYL